MWERIRKPHSDQIRPKTAVGPPDHPLEREADDATERVLSRPARAQAAEKSPPAAPASGSGASLGRGEPLDASTRAFFEPRFGHDFSHVRVHHNVDAQRSSAGLDAEAYTVGSHVVFGANRYAPGTSAGQRLLAHELAHVAQAGRDGGGEATVRRKIVPHKVSQELVGLSYRLTEPVTVGAVTVKADEVVKVVAYDNALLTAKVSHPTVPAPFEVPKYALTPDDAPVAGIAPYSAGLSRWQAKAQKATAAVEDFKKTEPTYKTEKGKRFFAKELADRTGEQTRLNTELNTRLIQASMLNRFDASIRKWVDHYNAEFGFTGKDACDPNLIKAAMFQESQMGTNDDIANVATVGAPAIIQNQFNLLQAIDSWPVEQLPVIREEAPGLIAKHHLEKVESDHLKVETELEKLQKKTTRSSAENTRLAELKELSKSDWQPWFLQYKAPGAATGFKEAIGEFLHTVVGGKERSVDYDFWVRVGVRAIFAKRTPGRSWPEAVRAYNGSGPDAEKYRKEVVKRAADAAKAEKDKKEFVPANL